MNSLTRSTKLSIWGLALGYFIFYVPYSAMTKALSKGLLPGTDGPISGFEMLPTVVIGTFIMFMVLIHVNGWWKYATFYKVGRFKIPFASNKWTILSGISAAFIIITTTLAYSFTGISIVFAALLMRGGVLVMSPMIDAVFKRKVNWYSWVALGMSLTALFIIFFEKGGYLLNIAVGINIGAYLLGYLFRLQFMTHAAKSKNKTTNYQFFVEEMLVAAVAIIVLPLLVAVLGIGEIGQSALQGFTVFIFSKLAIPALTIGALYACLYIFGTRIYLDHRENTYCIPFNRCASLLAGVVAAGLLSIVFGGSYVSTYQLISAAILIGAILVLSYPTIQNWNPRSSSFVPIINKKFVFVCPGNTGRSPMAQAICRAELIAALKQQGIQPHQYKFEVISAGLKAKTGSPISPNAKKALEKLGIPVMLHEATNLDQNLVSKADQIFCMSNEHLKMIEERFPESEGKVLCLDPNDGIPVPHGNEFDVYYECANYLRQLIKRNLQRMKDLQLSEYAQ